MIIQDDLILDEKNGKTDMLDRVLGQGWGFLG